MSEDKIKNDFIDCVVETLGINMSDNLEYDLDNIWPMIFVTMRDHFVDANDMVMLQAKRELNYLALALHRDFYSKESPNFELCDSVLGVVSQIDNMISGILKKKDKLKPIRDVYNFIASLDEPIFLEVLSEQMWDAIKKAIEE